MAKIPVALQVYTVRDQIEKDPVGTYQKIAEIGYTAVEVGAQGMPACEMKALLDDHGFACAGMHSSIEALEADLNAATDYAHGIGTKFITCSYMPEERRRDAAGWKATAKVLCQIAGKIAEAGLVFSYHNHSFEFQKFDGEYGLDILYGNSCAALKAQIDTYWVQHGGEDPAAYIRKYAGRVPLVHIKDMTAGDEPTFTEIGNGILDWPAIFAASEAAGTEWLIVEQDVCAGPSLESAKMSYENLKKMGAI